MHTIDLRSDTVTKPSKAMLEAMFSAELGDDVYGEDPTINKLEKKAADMTGLEKAIFVPSGTQGNLLALLAHCERGDEYIAGQVAHTYIYEGGGAAVLGSIQPQPINEEPDGTLNLDLVKSKIKPDDPHFTKTKLLSLENTNNGKVLPLDYIRKVSEFAKDNYLKLHLDGARAFNAAVKLGVSIDDIAKNFDSVSICLSKGLGAPVGSVLCGSEEVINKARRWRKVLGGGMRQAGILAAAGIFALDNNIERLSIDHENAKLLYNGLKDIPYLSGRLSDVQTNMVFIDLDEKNSKDLETHMKNENILFSGYGLTRLVTHLDISKEDIFKTIEVFKSYFSQRQFS